MSIPPKLGSFRISPLTAEHAENGEANMPISDFDFHISAFRPAAGDWLRFFNVVPNRAPRYFLPLLSCPRRRESRISDFEFRASDVRPSPADWLCFSSTPIATKTQRHEDKPRHCTFVVRYSIFQSSCMLHSTILNS